MSQEEADWNAPEATIVRLSQYLNELVIPLNELNYKKISFKLNLIEMVLQKLRSAHKSSGLSSDQITQIQNLKASGNVDKARDILHKYLDTVHAENCNRAGRPHPGTRSTAKRQRSAKCYSCSESLDTSINIECIACGWIICWCGACGCGFNR